MSREIKFRAYDSNNDFMFYHDEEGEFKREIDNQRVGSDFDVNDLLYTPFECLIAMQFTGLTDKNGVEIYCGDILGEKERIEEDNVFVCEYVLDCLGYVFTSPYDGESFKNDEISDLEVIGNIHENPELL